MILILKATGKDGLFRDFTCRLDRLEVAFDVLSRLAGQGETLREAHIIDKDNRLDLPVDIFDGEPFEEPMLRLEQEWQRILNVPAPVRTSGSEETAVLIHRWNTTEQAHTDHLTLVIDRFEKLLQSAEERMLDGPQRDRLIAHYQTTISRYHKYQNRSKQNGPVAFTRLQQANQKVR